VVVKYLEEKARFIEQEKKLLEDKILEEFVRQCKKYKLDSAFWGPFSNEYIRKGKKVQIKNLDDLDAFYCDNISAGGLVCKWTKEDGFNC